MESTGRDKKGEGSLIQRLLSFFAGMGDPDAEKKKILKAIGKDLSRSRFKFYRPKGQEALPSLAKFFYELYKLTAPASVLLGNASNSAALRSFVIESFLTKEQRELLERLTEASILERAKTMSLKDLQEGVKNDLTTFYAVFDGDMSRQIDSSYNTILSLVNFVNFDFYFLLKKSDSSLVEKSFGRAPKFEAINADYVADDLEDFLEVFLPLDFEADWHHIFEALHAYRNADVIQVDAWQKIVPALGEVRKSQVLEQIVRHVKRDPLWTPQTHYPNERIVEPFLQKLKAQIETLLQGLIQEKRNAKIDEIAKMVFGTSVVLRMKNYTDKANVLFAKKMLGGYTQTQALNYLKAYLMDYFKKDIRELVDLLIIRGQWTTMVQSQQLSDGYHALLEISDQILAFDESLSDDAEIGGKIKSSLAKSDRDKEQVKYLRNMLRDINDNAAGIITKSAVNLIQVGRQLKALIEDYERPHHEVVTNWKVIEGAASQPIKEWLVEVYKKIYYMVQLLQFYAKSAE
jgi:hypothetical protein